MDIFAVVVLILLGTAMIAFVVSPATARGLDTFGAGFVPYRGPGWPHGVQEEEPVHWSWSPPPGPDAADDGSGTGLEPELVEISGPDAPTASSVLPGPTVHPRPD
jgi:hypothetical protein